MNAGEFHRLEVLAQRGFFSDFLPLGKGIFRSGKDIDIPSFLKGAPGGFCEEEYGICSFLLTPLGARGAKPANGVPGPDPGAKTDYFDVKKSGLRAE